MKEEPKQSDIFTCIRCLFKFPLEQMNETYAPNGNPVYYCDNCLKVMPENHKVNLVFTKSQ